MPNTYVRRAGERFPKTRQFKVYVPWWVDPYFWIQGSSIEKLVMAELVRRGIYFEHTPQRNNIGGIVDPTWEPDFLFPQYKIWLEIQGSYFHSLPGQIEQDALRAAYIEYEGWRFLAWWEGDIETRLIDLVNEVPEFYRVDPRLQTGRRSEGLPFYEGGVGIDHLAGLRKANASRRRPEQYLFRRRTRRKPK